MGGDTFITNLPERVVGGFRAARGVGEGWVSVPYRTDDFEGVGIAAGAHSGAPPLTIRLGSQGSGTVHVAVAPSTSLQVWLDGEEGFREFNTVHGGALFQECALHVADLTGRDLHVALKPGPAAVPAWLAYVRIVPCAARVRSAGNMVGTNDGFSWIALDDMESVRDVYKMFVPYRDSDFFRVLWCPCGADVTGNHMTRAGTVMPFDATHAFRDCDRTYAAATGRILEAGGDILAAAVEGARDVGVEIHFYIRPEAFFCPFPHDVTFVSRFMLDHPELRCRDEFGGEVMRLSYAHAAVQDHMLEYFAELLEYEPDGLCMAFNRSLPMVICEEPVLEEFERAHGRRPKLPDEVNSPEMLAVRQSVLTRFLERVGGMLDERGMTLCCIAEGDNRLNLLKGLDVAAIVKRGLVDCVMVSGYALEQRFWSEISRAEDVRVYGSVPNWPPSYDYVEVARQMRSVFQAGLDGGFFWDVEGMFSNPYNWHLVRRLGTLEYLEQTIAGRNPGPAFRPIVEVRGVRRDRYDPWSSY